MTQKIRRAVAALGFGLSVVGLAAVVRPGLLSGVPSNDAFVTLAGLAVAALGVHGLLPDRREAAEYVELPAVESRSTATVPGDAFDRALVGRSPSVRDQLRAATVRTLGGRTELTASEARDRIADGTWTDDTAAAAFFSASIAHEDDRTVGGRVRASLGFERTDVVHQVRRVVAALGRTTAVDGLESVPGPDPTERPVRLRADAGHPARPDGLGGFADDSLTLPEVGESVVRDTARWRGIGSLALVAAGLGGVFRQPALLLVAAVGAALATYDAYGRAGTLPEPTLEIRREVSDPEPAVGETIDVTVTIANDGEDRLVDFRYVDGVPAGLELLDGSARIATTLGPSQEVTLTYSLRAEHGRHEFEPGYVVVREPSAATERTVAVEADGPSVVCRASLARGPSVGMPLRRQTTSLSGSIPAAVGEGVEFFESREYQHGDPASLIDWKRYARTGDLSTIRFREERTASVVLIIDARAEAYAAPEPTGRPAVRRCIDAAITVLDDLLADGHFVGLTALTPRDPPWIPPGGSEDHRVRVRETLTTHPALSPRSPSGTFLPSVAGAAIRRRLPTGSQTVVFSPLPDEYSSEFVRLLEAHDHATTVVSPDPTAASSTGRALARVERARRIGDLRASGIPVHDWDADDSLAVAVTRSAGGGRGGSRV